MGGTIAAPPPAEGGAVAQPFTGRMDDRKYHLLLRIHENGMRAMLGVTKHPDWRNKPHVTSYFDCIIGARVARMAYDRYPDAPEPVRAFLRLHHMHEVCHCTMERNPVPAKIADRIADFLIGVMKEHGLVAYLSCAQLTAERSAFGLALFGQFPDDPHTTTKGGIDEFYHTTTPLLLLAYLNPSEEELLQAIHDQEAFLKLVKVPSEGLYAPTLEMRCTLAGREAHFV
jgi:hypothetical protein